MDRLLATGSDDFTVRVWHAVDGEIVGTLGGHGGAINALFFPSNNRIVSASADGTVRLWNVPLSAQPLVVSGKRSYNGGASAVSGDGTLVSMSWGDNEVRILNIVSGKTVATLRTLPSEQFQNFIPKSHLLMVTSNYGIELWSPAGEKIGEMKLPFAPGHSVYFAASGDRLAVNDGRGLRIMTIWTNTAALIQAAQQSSTRDLTMDQRYSKFLK